MTAETMKKIDQSFWDQTLCSGRLLLQMGPRRLSLLEAGQIIDKKFLDKYKNSELYLEPVADLNRVNEFKKMFADLKSKKFEREQREQAKLILSEVIKDWSHSEAHLLTFAQASFEVLNTLPHEELYKIDSTDLRLFKKALYASAISVVIGMSNDYFEFNLLKDIYQITFVLDAGLCGPNYSYHIANAVDAESQKSGEGIKYLNQVKASEKEKELFFKHPEASHDLIESLQFNLTYPELTEIVLFQHETATGKGFPRGITKREISTWDAVCLLADGVVAMSQIEKVEKNTINYLLKISMEKQDILPIKKVLGRFKEIVRYFNSKQIEEGAA